MPAAASLLIDDEEKFGESVAASFDASGLELDRALTWDEGILRFWAGLHELVIADYNLPGSNHGLKLLLEAKRLRPSSKLILISGAVTPSGSDLIDASGLIDRFIPKTGDMAAELVSEGRTAAARMAEPTDWRRFAAAYVSKKEIDEPSLERVDAALRTQLPSRK